MEWVHSAIKKAYMPVARKTAMQISLFLLDISTTIISFAVIVIKLYYISCTLCTSASKSPYCLNDWHACTVNAFVRQNKNKGLPHILYIMHNQTKTVKSMLFLISLYETMSLSAYWVLVSARHLFLFGRGVSQNVHCSLRLTGSYWFYLYTSILVYTYVGLYEVFFLLLSFVSWKSWSLWWQH